MLVTVIIPCHNVSDYIEECLDSAYAKTYQHIEVIAIDNNSTDDTYIKLEQLKQTKYPNLIVLQELKKGACAARNKGLSVAKGDWIQFLDADDLLLPTKIEHQVNLLKDQNDLAFVAGAYISQNSKGENYKTNLIGESSNWVNVFVRQAGITSSNLFSKEWLKKVNGWDESLTSSQETDLMMRIFLVGGTFLSDQKPLTIIRERTSGQISQSNPAKRWENIVKYRIGYIEEIEKKQPQIYLNIQSELVSFLVSSIIILSSFDKALALRHATQLGNIKSKLLPLYGLNSKTILIIKMIGLIRFVKLKNR